MSAGVSLSGVDREWSSHSIAAATTVTIDAIIVELGHTTDSTLNF